MATLADEFLNDFGDEAPAEDDQEVNDDAMQLEEDLDREQEQLDEKRLLEALKSDNIRKVATLLESESFKTLLRKIDECGSQPAAQSSERLEDDPEYQIIVDSNQVISEAGNEIGLIHKYIRDKYSQKFPELESLVLNPLDYARVVKKIANQSDITLVDLADVLPSATIMLVSVAASTTSMKPLEEKTLAQVLDACDMALALDDAKQKILAYVESRMTFIAPNVSALVGSAVAAKLVAAAGGVPALCKIPANNVQLLGAPKRALAGFSSAQSRRSVNGYIHDADILHNTPPDLRLKAVRLIAYKVALASRMDACGSSRDGSQGAAYKEEIVRKVEKLQEPAPARQLKPLQPPDDRPKKKRGGARVRKQKQMYGQTEMSKLTNRMAFGEAEQTTMYGDTEKGLGMLGTMQTGKVRLSAQEKGQLKKQKQQLQKAPTSGIATSGLSTSLAFTPVQGLELGNPEAQRQAAAKVKQANERYFGSNGTFSNVKRQKLE